MIIVIDGVVLVVKRLDVKCVNLWLIMIFSIPK